jgi:hypothetical protein
VEKQKEYSRFTVSVVFIEKVKGVKEQDYPEC